MPSDPASTPSSAGMDRPRRRPGGRWRRGLPFLGVLSVVCLIAVGVAILETPPRITLDRDALQISQVRRGVFEDFIPVRGRVAPRRTVYLDALEGGRVESVQVEDGARVAPGDILLRLSNTQLQLDVIAREAEVAQQLNNLNTLALALEQNRLGHKLSLTEIDFQIVRLGREAERRRYLGARDAVSRSALEDVEDELAFWQRREAVTREAQDTDLRMQRAQMVQLRTVTDRLQANLAVAQANLDALTIRAPLAGTLTAFDLVVGQSLDKGERMGQIDDPDGFKVSALIDEFHIDRVALAQEARADVAGRDVALTVSKIYPQVRNGVFEVDFAFADASQLGIRRGQTQQLRLFFDAPSDSLLIPNGAFYEETGGVWVFVLTADGTMAVRRPIRTGRRNARDIEVLDGLVSGDAILSSSYAGFSDQDRIRISP